MVTVTPSSKDGISSYQPMCHFSRAAMHVSGSVYTDSRLIGCQLINLECAGSMQLSSSGQMFSPVLSSGRERLQLEKGAFISQQESSYNCCVGSVTENCFANTATRKGSFGITAAAALEAFPFILNTDQMARKLTLFRSANSDFFFYLPRPPSSPEPTSSSADTTTAHSSSPLSFLLKTAAAVYQRVTGST